MNPIQPNIQCIANIYIGAVYIPSFPQSAYAQRFFDKSMEISRRVSRRFNKNLILISLVSLLE